MPEAPCNDLCQGDCSPIKGCAFNLLNLCGECIEPSGAAEMTLLKDAPPDSALVAFVRAFIHDDKFAAARVLAARVVRRMKGTTTKLPLRRPTITQGMDVDNTFTYHAPFGSQVQRYGDIRVVARDFARLIQESSHPSREQALALTHLQQTVMFANAAIAINEVE